MEYLQDLVKQLTSMSLSDYVDIAIVAYIIYCVIRMIRSTTTMRIAGVVVAMLVAAWCTQLWDLHTLSFLLNQVLAVGMLSLVILFQPELRRMMDHLGSVSIKQLISPKENVEQMELVISQTVMACEVMSHDKIGALIVFARNQRLEEYFKTGTIINGKVSEQLIRNIFFPKAALHDGAMIIRDGEIAATGCVLPLSESHRLSADLGTRHRAGVGMSEASDAVVVIVSEETGSISVAIGGMLKRHLKPETLENILRNELIPQGDEEKQKFSLLGLLQPKKNGGGDDDE